MKIFNKKDIDIFLSDDIVVFNQYKNKELKTIVSDFNDDGTITYKMNEHGYRSNSLKNKKDFNILTLGCSWTMGCGVKVDNIWPTLISNKIQNYLEKEIALFNYGMYGVSPSFCSKTYYKIITKFKPDLVLIMWPGFSRRDYIKESGEFKKIGGFRAADKNDLVWKNENEDIHFIELRNDYQDLMEFWEAYKFVEQISKLHKIKTIHTVAGYYYEIYYKLKHKLKNTIDKKIFFEPKNCYKSDMKARDNHHPGEQWHQNFSDEFFKFIKQLL